MNSSSFKKENLVWRVQLSFITGSVFAYILTIFWERSSSVISWDDSWSDEASWFPKFSRTLLISNACTLVQAWCVWQWSTDTYPYRFDYIYMYTYISVCVCVCIYKYINKWVYEYICTHRYMHTCICTHTHVYINIHVYIYVLIYGYLYVCMCVYIHVFTTRRTHTHKYTHTWQDVNTTRHTHSSDCVGAPPLPHPMHIYTHTCIH